MYNIFNTIQVTAIAKTPDLVTTMCNIVLSQIFTTGNTVYTAHKYKISDRILFSIYKYSSADI